jgi:hypothetical protein
MAVHGVDALEHDDLRRAKWVLLEFFLEVLDVVPIAALPLYPKFPR